MSARETAESDSLPPAPRRIRLQRYLASCGLGSRRACEEFIEMGRVTVDGVVISEQGTQIDPQTQKIALDGQKLKMERKKYYVFNKPPGVLCTNKDPEGRPRVIDFFPEEGPRVFSVGRLDEDSEGLLIVTNDGDLAQKMAHPSYRIFRTYHVLVAGAPTLETLKELRQGIYFDEGRFRVEGVKSIKKQGQSTWCEVVLAEGHNREVRRLFSRVGHKVMKLQRVAFGPIFLGKMARGEIREIRRDELERLFGMLERNEESRQANKGKRVRPTSRPGMGPRRQSDGDLLNKSSRNAPPERKTGPSRGGPVPKRPMPSGLAGRGGPPSAFPKRPFESGPREERGLGIEDIPDEQMMGLADRPAGRSGTRSRPVGPPQRTEGGPKKFSSGGQRRPSDLDRGPRRPAQRSSSQTGKSAANKVPKGTLAKGKRPRTKDQPTESFGRRSPGQPKGPKRKPPRGR